VTENPNNTAKETVSTSSMGKPNMGRPKVAGEGVMKIFIIMGCASYPCKSHHNDY